MSSKRISGALLSDRVEAILKEAPSAEAGLFGPDSITWKINRHSALFAGSWRAALLQLAHPWVAQSLQDHSSMEFDPISRFHRTFRVVFTMVFGSVREVRQVAVALHQLHETIQGELQEGLSPHHPGTAYQANHRDAMIWVLATLWDTALLCYDRLVEPLTPEDREAYYREGRKFAALFGIDGEDLPPDWASFARYMAAVVEDGTIQVTPTAKRLGAFLFEAPQVPLHSLWERRARIFTGEWMPEPLRESFGFPTSSPGQWKEYACEMKRVRKLYHMLPARMKYVPPYFEAQRRIRGKQHVDFLTRAGNRLWIGQPTLLSTASAS